MKDTCIIAKDWEGETKEEEWNFLYNNKKISIEALEHIEIKNRGEGAEKEEYNSKTFTCGPCYDPLNIHVHVWKKDTSIKNFIGEQKQNVKNIQYTDYKPGTYCSICHQSAQTFHMKLFDKSKIEKTYINIDFSYSNYSTEKNDVIVSNAIPNWKKLLTKHLYSMKNEKILYPISSFKTLLLWPWQMTPYQKFKLNNMNYKNNKVFIKNKFEEFKNSYAVIV